MSVELPAVARLYYTGNTRRRYKRASVQSGPGEPLCFVSVAEYAIARRDAQIRTLEQELEAERAATGVDVDDAWTDDQCAEFMAVAMRHCTVKGEFRWDDIRMGQKRANALRADKTDGGA